MSFTIPGHYVCDRCGADVGNGDITHALVVSDLDPDREGMVRALHFCRENGCDKKVLSARNTEALRARTEKEHAAGSDS